MAHEPATTSTSADRKVRTAPGIDAQRVYYDERWAQARYANALELRRAVAILDGLRRVKCRAPKILDLGCGTGWLASILGRFGPATGIDLSPTAIELAQARYPDVRFIAADFSDLPADETFDVVVSQEVIEHVEDQRGYVELVARLLNPEGLLILTTPNAWNLTHWTRESIDEWGLQPIEHWLTRTQLRSLLSQQFNIKQLRTIILGHGTRGIFRLTNSPKLNALLNAVGLRSLYDRWLEWLGFGLHLCVVAEKR